MSDRVFKLVLRPTRCFYFGNERTLGPNNSDYYVVSNLFPQQTTLLGVLRYKILEWQDGLADAEGNWPREARDIQRWIGPSSFRGVDAPGRPADYGYIKAISPVLLYDGNACWVVAPKPLGAEKVFGYQALSGEAWLGLTVKKVPELESFDPKKIPASRVFNLETGELRALKASLSSNRSGGNCKGDFHQGVFIPVTRVGITKPTREYPDQEKGFYKQTFWRFPSVDWGFVCWVSFTENMEVKRFMKFVNDYPLTPVGGERSIFRLSLVEEPIPKFDRLAELMPEQGHQIVLLSDAWASNCVYEKVDFAVSEVVDFRFISTRVGQTRWYSSMDYEGRQGGGMPSKSLKYHLLEKGTTFYSEGLPEDLAIPVAFRQIGYNAYARFSAGNLVDVEFIFKQ